MDDLRVGSLVRAVRHRRGWTQRQLGARVGVSQQLISLIERGHLARVAIGTLRRVAAGLEIQLPFAPRWRGGDGARLLDADHAVLVNALVTILRRAGWETIVEFTFSEYGERGAVDVIGWNAAASGLLIAEVKPRILDTQETIGTLDRKARLVPAVLARDRGWRATTIGIVLCLPGFTANRSSIARHASTFAAALPARAPDVRRWLRRPEGRLAGIWFLSATTMDGSTRLGATRRRVRASSPTLMEGERASAPPAAKVDGKGASARPA